MYQRKYWGWSTFILYDGENDRHTWLVHTLLNDTKAKVCASIVDGRSFFARRRGRAKAERKSCGRKAKDSSLTE